MLEHASERRRVVALSGVCRRSGAVSLAFALCFSCPSAIRAQGGQTEAAVTQLPDAPAPQKAVEPQHPKYSPPHEPLIGTTSSGNPCERVHGTPEGVTSNGTPVAPCPHHTIPQTSERFVNGEEVDNLTVKDKARLAERDLVDPYDAATVVGDSGVTVAADARGKYGAGMKGFGKAAGVELAQDSSAEVTNTFLLPSITHQDPRYHREPGQSKMHRIEHAFADTVWTQSDKGKGMPNYSNLLGDAGDDELGNLYEPGVRTNPIATAERFGVSLAMTPVDNLVTEFTPDIASHIHLKSAFWQNIVDRVGGVAGGGGALAAARHGGAPSHRSGHKR